MMNVYALKCPPLADLRAGESLLNRVSAERRRKIHRYRNAEDANSSLWSELLLRAVIRETTGLPTHEIVFGKNRYEKPFLTGDTSLQFNLSHSGAWIFCALDTKPVGADIEKIQPVSPGLVDLTLSAPERQLYDTLPSRNRLSCFFTLWTCKESFLKAIGTGLHSLPSELSVVIDQEQVTGTVSGHTHKKGGYCRIYPFIPGYRAAVCSFQNSFPATVIQKVPHSVIQSIQ